MLFSESKQFDEYEVELVKSLLEKMIGRQPDLCRKIAEKKEFIFLDSWNDKMGFVKESNDYYLILSLQFEDSVCNNYQLILKNSSQKWSESRTIDYDVVRRTGIID